MNPLWNMLETAAALNPADPALHTETRTYSFDELRTIATNIARELRNQGLRPGDVVATLLPNAMDWMVTLAAAHEGLLSVSLHHGGQAIDVDAALVVAVSERLTISPDPTIPVLLISEQWVRGTEGSPDPTPAREYGGPESLVRLVLTSGTTGKAKAAEYTAGTVTSLAAGAVTALGHGGDLRLSFMGFSTMGGVYQALAHLSLRTPFVAVNAITDRIPALIDELGITVVVSSTISLSQLCDAYDAHPEITPKLQRIIIAGSTPADALLRRLSAKFTKAELAIMYGSTEGGLIAAKNAVIDSDPRIVGHVVPHVQLEIVDEQGNPVPHGGVGEVRYRSNELIERYYRDPEATALFIRDGWFYPGDRARFVETGELMIVGRLDDVMNLGGVKVDPVSLESIALAVPGVTGAAAYLVHDEQGRPQIEMAIVADTDEKMRVVDVQIRAQSATVVPSIYRRVASLPHNQMGKLMRNEIAAYITEHSP